MTREELIGSREYWITRIQLELYQELETFMKDTAMNRTQLAERLGVTKGYVSQVMNGDFDHKISKLVELALLMGKVPVLSFQSLDEAISKDQVATSEGVLA